LPFKFELVPTVKCANCKRPVKLNETVIFWKYEKMLIPEWKIHWRTLNTEKVKDNVVWQPSVWMRVCLDCYKKLSEEQELRMKGLVKCKYCETVHNEGEKCPTCGAPA
jgi:DNA-directed RNA polymerase subunit RPC12/RpoP